MEEKTERKGGEGMKENSRLGKYKIMGALGRGGEGCVYLARDESLFRPVALKRLWDSGDADSGQLAREAAFLRDLRHPALPVVYELFYEGGWYLAMEYMEGISLHKYISGGGPVGEEQARLWAGVLLDVLSYLHTRETPVIYRDLKPDNIMVCRDGSVRLVDFGAAAFRSFGESGEAKMAYTAGFAAPEQRREEGRRAWADERSDIYAFGKILCYMVTGAEPEAAACAALSPSCYNPLLSAELEAVITRCTMEKPEDRYQVVSEIIRDIDRRDRWKKGGRKREFVRHVEKQVLLAAAGSGVILRERGI